MNPRFLVKLSNCIGIVAILALLYWVFAFVVIEVFGLKIFRGSITELFFMSSLGILAVMAGALMLNIMFNLTQIAENHQPSTKTTLSKTQKGIFGALLLLFPVILALLFLGDYANTQKKKRLMMEVGEQLVQDTNNPIKITQMLQQPKITVADLERVNPYLYYLEGMVKANLSVEYIGVIMPNKTQDGYWYVDTQTTHSAIYQYSPAILEAKHGQLSDEQRLAKVVDTRLFVYTPSGNEQQYLEQVFANQDKQVYFDAHEGNFTLFYPYHINGETVAVYKLSDYMQYGKY